ncbi:MAG: hypothetical protein BJ554DRAFT_4729, partial [Olpidium bornovanus]
MKLARCCLLLALLVPAALAAAQPPPGENPGDIFSSQVLLDLFADSADNDLPQREDRIIDAFYKRDAPLFFQLLRCDLCEEHVTSSSAHFEGENWSLMFNDDVLNTLLRHLEGQGLISPNLGEKAFKPLAHLIVRHIKRVEVAILEAAAALNDCKDFRLVINGFLEKRAVAVPVCYLSGQDLLKIFKPDFVTRPDLQDERLRTLFRAYAGSGPVLDIFYGKILHGGSKFTEIGCLMTHHIRRGFVMAMSPVVDGVLRFLPTHPAIPDIVKVRQTPGIPPLYPVESEMTWTREPAMRVSDWLAQLAPALTTYLVDTLESTDPGAHVDNLKKWAEIMKNVEDLMHQLLTQTVHIPSKGVEDYLSSLSTMSFVFGRANVANEDDRCIADSDRANVA